MGSYHVTLDRLETRDIAADTASMRRRIEAYRERQPTNQRELIIPTGTELPSASHGAVPEVTPAELSSEVLKRAIREHGALLVRNFFSAEEISAIPAAIDRVLAAVDLPPAEKKKLCNTYFSPPDNLVSIMPEGPMELAALRVFNTRVGAVMCPEAPAVAEALLKLFEARGVKDLVTDYLGESPCLTVKKWVLRRSVLPVEKAGWHQDGAFMGTEINTLNLWLPLTECGGETGAPGMDLVPQRLNSIVSADGATFDWSVSDSQVTNTFDGNRPIAPVFNAGDAFFFDHFYLHRTQFREDFSRLRYAIETWFFGETTFPKSQIPLAW